MTDNDSEKEAKYNKKSNGYKEDEIGKGFETEPVRQCSKWFWEDGD